MSKKITLIFAVLFIFTGIVRATDTDIAVASKQYLIEILTEGDYNWFDQVSLVNLLVGAQELLNNTYSFNGSNMWGGGTYNAGATYNGSYWVPNGSHLDDTDATNEVTAIQNWLNAGADWQNPDAMEGTAQQLLSEGQEIHMMGNDTQASELTIQAAGTTDINDGNPVSNTDLYFYGRSTTWPSGGDAVGNTEMFKITNDQGASYTFNFAGTQSPIVLDMDGNGKLEASNGQWLPHSFNRKDIDKYVSFDMNCDGFKDLTEWVGANDGLLVTYEGGEMTAANLYGNEGGRYKNGFEKLSLLDANNDKKLTGDELSTLSVWQDNGNAKVDEGEISSLDSLGITEIRLNHKGLVSSFMQNGARKTLWDWYPCAAPVKRHRK